MISLSETVLANSNHVFTDVADEVVILNTENGVYYSLNPVGAFIWHLVQEPKNLGDVCSAVMAEYDVDPARCEHDVLTLVNDLAKQGLIHVQTT